MMAISAMILVFLGPAMDHHFAERQHDHSHLYLTSPAAGFEHPGLHPFEQTHSHDGSSTDGAGYDGILYQTSDNGSEDSGSIVFGAVINDSLTPIGAVDSLSLSIAAGDGPYFEAFVAPPKKPPRA